MVQNQNIKKAVLMIDILSIIQLILLILLSMYCYYKFKNWNVA